LKTLFLLVLTVFILPNQLTLAGEPPPDRWLAVDKLQHLIFSTHLSLLSYKVSRDSYHNTTATARAESIGLVFSLGIGKEFLDSHKPNGRFSYRDLIADALGIGLGLLLGHNLK
jgi:uncharacterized protein YfiM (DUF2279 family)